MGKKVFFRLSRRDLLKRSVLGLGGLVFTKLSQGLSIVSAFAQINPKRIYIAPDDHTDYFWSAGEETYRQAFVETIDYYLNLTDSTANEPSEHQSRWNCDGSFWMWTYEKNKPLIDFERFIGRIQSGHISVPLNALCVCLGGAPAEAVLRGMYYSGHIERRYNIRFSLAYGIENQTQPYGLISLWKGAGARYSWKGICGCDSRIPNAWDREHDIYWWVGPDNSKMLIKWNSMLGGSGGFPNEGMGGYAEARDPAAVVEYVDSNSAFKARYPYKVIGAFGKGWDDLKTLTDEFVSTAKNKTNANRTIIVSNEMDFFQDFEITYGSVIPSHACTFGNEWDLYCAALAEVSARVKRAIEKLRGAEALATWVSLQDFSFMNGRETDRDLAWVNLGLFWEHNFGMVNPPSGLTNARITWQRRLASEIEDYVNSLHTDAANTLGGLIPKNGANLRFYAFNSLSWTRTDLADFQYSQAGSVHVIDISTGLETPAQFVNIDGQQYLRVLAQNIPPAGYKVFEVRSGSGQSFSDEPTANAATGLIENSIYAITVAPRGAITSLVDKTQANKQFSKEIGGYAINDLGSSSGTLVIENAGPVSITLKATASNPLAHTTQITLIRNSRRVDIKNEITQNFNSTYRWRFGFELNTPDMWHEEVGAIIRAKLLNQGGHYSDRVDNARYDWLTLNHFADMSGSEGAGVTLSNADCYFMKLGNSTTGLLDTSTPQISLLVGGRVANGNKGLPNQGGDDHFLQRFALRAHTGYDPVNSMKFALEHQNPLVTGEISGGDVYPETSYAFLTVDNPNVLLWALKPADDGIDEGIITRFWNLGNLQEPFSLSFADRVVDTAMHTTHIETPLENANVSAGNLVDNLNPHQLKTYAVKLAPMPRSHLPVILRNK